jgi:serine protease Do
MSIPVPGQVAELLRRSTVAIHCSGVEQGSGSGFVIGPNRIVTNAHVISGSRVTVDSWEGKSFTGKLLMRDRRRDLALLEVAGLSSRPASLADSRVLRTGTPVFAVGNPWGFVGAVSSGFVRTHVFPAADRPYDISWICSDLQLAPGSSGGPLANFDGQVLGVNTMVATGQIALAVPSQVLQAFLGEKRSEFWLGITARAVRWRDGAIGMMLLEVEPNGAADRASLLAGDILVSANGKRFRSPEDLSDAISRSPEGLLKLEFYRGDHTLLRQVSVRLERERQAA